MKKLDRLMMDEDFLILIRKIKIIICVFLLLLLAAKVVRGHDTYMPHPGLHSGSDPMLRDPVLNPFPSPSPSQRLEQGLDYTIDDLWNWINQGTGYQSYGPSYYYPYNYNYFYPYYYRPYHSPGYYPRYHKRWRYKRWKYR